MAESKGELLELITSTLDKLQEEWLKTPYIDKFVSYHNDFEGQNAKFIDYTCNNGEKLRFIVFEPDLVRNEYVFILKNFKTKKGIKSKRKALYDKAKDLLIKITNKSIQRPVKENCKKQQARLTTINRLIVLKQAEIDSMLGFEENYLSLVNELNAYKLMSEKLSQK